MNVMGIARKLSLSGRNSAVRRWSLSLSVVFVFVMVGCGPCSDTPDAKLAASSATPAPSAPPRPVVRAQVELAAAFDASTETILDLKDSRDLTKLKALRQVDLSAAAN